MNKRNIAIVWDFDGTLTPVDSTLEVVEFLSPGNRAIFWDKIHKLNGKDKGQTWENILASDTPTWMYVLSEFARKAKKVLVPQFFSEITHLVELYPNTVNFLNAIKAIEQTKDFKDSSIEIHHFIVSAGLKDYIEELVPKDLFRCIWGGRYKGGIMPMEDESEKVELRSIPIFCLDETMKTRALFEISKGVFVGTTEKVNDRVEKSKLWCPFENLIYIGDGPTDIPSLSLTRDRGGYGIVVFDPNSDKKKTLSRLKNMSAENRCDLITAADFSDNSPLFVAIKNKCIQILQKYQAEDFSKEIVKYPS